MRKDTIRRITGRALLVSTLLGAASVTNPQQANADPIDAICYAAAIGTGFWPVGTLIAGPTALGCVIYYWQV